MHGWLPAWARDPRLAFVPLLLAAAGLAAPPAAEAADFAFIAGERPFAVAYAPRDAPGGRDARPIIVRNVGTMALDVRLGIGDRPFDEVFAVLAAGTAASFVTHRSLFVSCPDPDCRAPVEVNYFPAE